MDYSGLTKKQLETALNTAVIEIFSRIKELPIVDHKDIRSSDASGDGPD